MSIDDYVDRAGWPWFSGLYPLAGVSGSVFDDASVFGYAKYPPVNVWYSDDQIVVDAELPGVDPAQVAVTLQDDELTLSGTRPAAPAEEGQTFHRQERPYGRFARVLTLPFRGEPARVTATYRNGILRITVPRAETDKPRKIEVKAA